MQAQQFSFDTIKDFDRHIELSVPNYSHIFELIRGLSTYFIKEKSNVYDLGCSTGLLLNSMAQINTVENVRYIGYEISENMRPKEQGLSQWIKQDLTDPKLDLSNASLIFSIFTLQFIDIKERIKILQRVYDNLNLGGAFIICEKTFVEDGFMQDLFTFSYYDYKLKNFTEEEILKKQRDLRFIMRPLTQQENINMFESVGFKKIENFFSSLMFKGWIMVKN